MTTIERIAELRAMQGQIIHGSTFFGDTASELEALQKENAELNCSLEATGRVVLARDSTIEGLRTQNAELREALKLANGEEVTRAHAELFGIDFSKHECGCEVCSHTGMLCPATQSSIMHEIFNKALAAQPESQSPAEKG